MEIIRLFKRTDGSKRWVWRLNSSHVADDKYIS